MNTKEAVSFLEKQGFKIYCDGQPTDEQPFLFGRSIREKQRIRELKAARQRNDLFRVWNDNIYYGVYTGRELVKLARDSKNYGSMKKNLKKFDKAICRTKTRDLLKKEEFDKIPQNKKPSEENPWSWD